MNCPRCKSEFSQYLTKKVTFKNGTRHIEARCPVCNKYIKYLAHSEYNQLNSINQEVKTTKTQSYMRIRIDPVGNFKYSFEFPFSYEILDFCRYLRIKYAPSNFNYLPKGWRFNDLSIVETIKERFPETEIDPELFLDIEKFQLEKRSMALQEKKAEELKAATTSNLVVKNIKGELRLYQLIGLEFLINNKGRALLADQMGLGKSVQALAYVAHNEIAKTLVICPSSVKGVWTNEIKKFTKLKSYTIDSKTKLTPDIIGEYDIFIINYDILHKFLNILTTTRFDCSILDESQFFKSSQARRSKCVKLICRRIPSTILLSGSPLLNRPSELFNSLNIIDPKTWNNFWEFTKKYCNGHQGFFGWECSGASNISELRSRIGKYFLRREKEVVLKELPQKTFIDVPIVLENGDREKYDLAEQSFVEYLRNIKKKNKEEIARSMSAETIVKLGALRKLTSDGKVLMAKEIIENILESGEKVVVFSVYNSPLIELSKYFRDKSVILIGSTKEEERNKIISDFQSKDICRIFLGGMKSAGVGISLTSAPNVLMIDFPWVPADREQAIDRIHRYGQKANHATVYQLIAKNTIDQRMQDILNSKQEIFNQLIENKVVGNIEPISLVNNLLKEYGRTI